MRHTPWFRLQKGQEMVRLEYISILNETIPFLLRVGTQNMSIIATRGLVGTQNMSMNHIKVSRKKNQVIEVS